MEELPYKSQDMKQAFIVEAELKAQAQDRQTRSTSSSEKQLSRGAYILLVFAIIFLIIIGLFVLSSFLHVR